MRVRISARTGSYAIYVLRDDDDAFVERAMRIFSKYDVKWHQEIYDGRYKKIVVLRRVA
jgi:ketopantoate reductase